MEGRGMGISEKVSESLLAQLDRLELVNMDHVAYVEVIESCK